MTKKEKTIFMSHVINSRTPLYGGRNNIRLESVRSIEKGDGCNEMFWAFPNHIGTHIDAPSHFMKDGRTISQLSPEDLIFNKVMLVDMQDIRAGHIISSEDMPDIGDGEILLIRTGFEKYREERVYWENSPALYPDLAGWVTRRSPLIRAVGMDFLSVSSLSNREMGRAAHKAFLGKGLLLIEDMKLSGVDKAPDRVTVVPLMVEGADASPCTVFGSYAGE